MTALQRIYRNLQNERIYGKWFTNCKYPFFSQILYLTKGNFIGWTNAGSSANKNTLNDLQWIISNIFETTPEQFERDYLCFPLWEIMEKEERGDYN